MGGNPGEYNLPKQTQVFQERGSCSLSNADRLRKMKNYHWPVDLSSEVLWESLVDEWCQKLVWKLNWKLDSFKWLVEAEISL